MGANTSSTSEGESTTLVEEIPQSEATTQLEDTSQLIATTAIEEKIQVEPTNQPATSPPVEEPLQPQPPALPDPPTTDQDLDSYLHTLTTTTPLTPTAIANLKTNSKAWLQLLATNTHAAILKTHLETPPPPSDHSKNISDFARMYAIANLGECTELREFLASERTFQGQDVVRAVFRPARAVAWRVYCEYYPERFGFGFWGWEGVEEGGKVRTADFQTGKAPFWEEDKEE
ncbi:hypothetical protein EG328_008786 [Venturia inaequalis]|uniref:Uncharacterized protein n=1 Tax=Venturia inaequalis TaxID=5025 RepID=A0A8H3YN19_VENIN|nr:hypothetical protein EG328_008786 [Venturia inaequalis]KAE9969070.1 hypothetical protein EG327_010776 [Venturia inaequalis]RDI87697.1 Citrate synthase [Venturia inaequalis]